MLIKPFKTDPLRKHLHCSGKRAKFMQAALDHRNEGLNQLDFEKGAGSGLREGLKPTYKAVWRDGEIVWMRRQGTEWVPGRPPTPGDAPDKPVAIATGRKVSRRAK